jgi:hypothetical protein
MAKEQSTEPKMPDLSIASLPPSFLTQLVAAMFGAKADVRMRFQVERHKHVRKFDPESGTGVVHYERKITKNEEGDVISRLARVEQEKEEVIDGFMVYFPQGHSMFVETEEELHRLGLSKDAELVDMNTGLSMNEMMKRHQSPKQIVKRNTRNVMIDEEVN